TQNDISWVGVYAGRKESAAPAGPQHTAVIFFHKENPIPLKSGKVDVRLTARADLRWWAPGLNEHRPILSRPRTASYQEWPVPLAPLRWHTWSVVIASDVLTGTWDGQPLDPITAGGVTKHLNMMVPTLPPNLTPTFTPPMFGAAV